MNKLIKEVRFRGIMQNTHELTKDKIEEIALSCAENLEDKKAENIVLLDVSEITPITDYFLIASASSYLQLKVLNNHIEEQLSKLKIKRTNPSNPFSETPWVLSDYGFLVVHLFIDEAREYYNIEKFWHDADIVYKSEEN